MSLFSILSPNNRQIRPQSAASATDDELVQKIRLAVAEWRKNGYKGVSKTSLALLNFWFNVEHTSGGNFFYFFFYQREAIESIIYLFEVDKNLAQTGIIKTATSEHINENVFPENWLRYIIKIAPDAGKSNILGFTLVWSYFNKLYETDNTLSKNFLVVAPNPIALNSLLNDFNGIKMFFDEPFLPDNGFDDKDWKYDFQPTLHVQNDLKPIYDFGNIFLTDAHNLLLDERAGLLTDSSLIKTLRSEEVKNLIVLHAGFPENYIAALKYAKIIQDLNTNLKLKNNTGISIQIDCAATTNRFKGNKFVPTISSFSLVESLQYNLVKLVVLPDEATRQKTHEINSLHFMHNFRSFIELGYFEWKKQYEALKNLKSPILYIITMSAENADEAAHFLESKYPELKNAVLTINATNSDDILNGEIALSKEYHTRLQNKTADLFKKHSTYKAVVSSINFFEGWNLPNVTTLVCLQPTNDKFYNTRIKDAIFPEQFLALGLDKMFSHQITENLVVIGTPAFLETIENLKAEGIELKYSTMGSSINTISPLAVEIEFMQSEKNWESLNIKLPVLSPRFYREYKNLALIDESTFTHEKVQLKIFSTDELEEIVFNESSFNAVPSAIFLNAAPDYRNIISFFTVDILTESQIERGFSILYPKVENFIQKYLFNGEIDIANAQTMRNLAELNAKDILKSTFKRTIDELTIIDKGETLIENYVSLLETKRQVVDNHAYLAVKKSVFNKIVCDNAFELELATQFENIMADVSSFAKNTTGENGFNFKLEFPAEGGNIRQFYPTFFVKSLTNNIFIIEIQALDTVDKTREVHRLATWCNDVNAAQTDCIYTPIFINQAEWNACKQEIRSFADVAFRFKVKNDSNLDFKTSVANFN